MKKIIALLLTVSVFCCLCACAKPAESAAPAKTAISATDMTGQTVTLSAVPERIVVLSASDCEILCALGAQSRLVGRGEYCDYPASVQTLPAVQSGAETNLESILALQPDLVVLCNMDQSDEQIAQLKSAGIPVAVTYAQDLAGVYEAIALLGTLTGTADTAQELIASMQSSLDALSAHKDENAGKTVYFEVSPLQWGLWAAGSGSFMDEIAGLLGLTNIFSDIDGWGEVSEEQVLSRNPDYIVTITMYDGSGVSPTEEILSRPGWEQVSAVQSGKILNLTDNALSRPSQRLAEGAEQLAAFVAE